MPSAKGQRLIILHAGGVGGGGRSGIQIKDKLDRLPRRNEQQTLHEMDDTTVTIYLDLKNQL